MTRENNWDKDGLIDLYESISAITAEFDRLSGEVSGIPATVMSPKPGFGLGFPRATTTVDDLIAKDHCRREKAVAALQRIAKCGCGAFVTGRRGQKSRLLWRLSPIEVAKEVVDLASKKFEESEEVPPITTTSGGVEMVEQLMWVRPGVQVSLSFPVDLTKEEAEKVAGMVRNLWMGGSPTS